MSKRRKRQVSAIIFFFLAMVVMGGVGIITIRSLNPAETKTEKDSIIALIHQIEAENEQLSSSIEEIQKEIDEGNYGDFSGKEALADLEESTAERKTAAGFDSVEGPGLSIVLNDNLESAAKAMTENPEEYNAENYIVHDKNLLYLINDLRPYADAIAINHHRIITTTSIRCVGTVIMVDQMRLAPPYRIEVTGDPAVLLSHLEKCSEYDIIMDSELLLTVTKEDQLSLPAYSGTVSRDHITVDEETDKTEEAQ